MHKNIEQVLKKSTNDTDYVKFQKQQEFKQQEKKQSFQVNKMSFAMNQCISYDVKIEQKEIKFLFNYIDCEEYNNPDHPKILEPVLEIELQQNYQNDRQIEGKTVSLQSYYKEIFELNPTNKRLNLKKKQLNNKHVQQNFNLEKYDEKDTIKITIKGNNVEYSNYYPLYLFLDKFSIGQKFDIYISDGLYLNFETLYSQDYQNMDQIFEDKIERNEDLIESIYCDEFYKLPEQYTQFMQNFYQQLNEEEDQYQHMESNQGKESQNNNQTQNQRQQTEIKNKKDHKLIIQKIYVYQLKQISKHWIVQKDFVKQVENFIQKLQQKSNDDGTVNLINFYQDINSYFPLIKDQQFYDEDTFEQANTLLLSGLTMYLRIEFYQQYGQVAQIKKTFVDYIKQKLNQDITSENLYEFIKKKINVNCLLQQKLRDDISKFKSNIGNQYKQWAYQALQVWVSVIQQYLFNDLRVNYGQYILQYAFKLLQIIINHDSYKINSSISEELIFWLILSQSIYFNLDFQVEVKDSSSKQVLKDQLVSIVAIQNDSTQVYQRLKLNINITDLLIFLRYSIKKYYPKVYELIKKYKINFEMLFCDSLQQLCFDLLNSNMYYRILDIAYGLVFEGLGYFHFAIVLGIMHFFEEQIGYVYSYQSFIDILRFSAQNIYSETELINLILHYRIDLQQDYPNFKLLIEQKSEFYESKNKKQIAMELLLQEYQAFDLIDIQQIIEQFIPIENQKNLVVHDQFKAKPQFIHIFVQNPTHQAPYLSPKDELKQLINGYLRLAYQQNLEFVIEDKVILKIDCNSLPVNTLVQQNTISNICFNFLVQSENFLVNPNPIKELDLNIPQKYLEEFINCEQTFSIDNTQILLDIQKDQQCNAQNIFSDHIEWKQDSLIEEEQLKIIFQKSEIFNQNKKVDNFYSKFGNGHFYLKEFLLYLILNANGTLKQKMHVIYDSFKSLNNNIFSMQLMQNILTEVFQICKIPILKQELINHVSQVQYKSVNHIIEAKIEKGNKSVDITDLLQKYIDFYYLKYGTQSILLDDLNSIITDFKEQHNSNEISIIEDQNKISFKQMNQSQSSVKKQESQENQGKVLKKQTSNYVNCAHNMFGESQKDGFVNRNQDLIKQNSKYSNENNDILTESQKVAQADVSLVDRIQKLKGQNLHKTLQLKIDYKQNFQNRSVKYNLDDKLKIEIESHGDKCVQNLNILNMNYSYQEIEFSEFWKICNDCQILNNTIVQDHCLNRHSQKTIIECSFQIFVADQLLIHLVFKQNNFNKLVMFDVSEYQQKLQQPIKDTDESKDSLPYSIETDELDILLPFKHLCKQISNILILKHLNEPIPNLKNVDFMQKVKVTLVNDNTPSGIMDLSLVDIQQIKQKNYKDLEIKIQYEAVGGKQLKQEGEINTMKRYQF